MTACVVCGDSRWLRLPDPQPNRSLVSDLRIIERPLGKQGCLSCGAVGQSLCGDDFAASVATNYELYDHAPRWPREELRQRLYASWIASSIDAVPEHILDIGCANGSLLLALGQRWPRATLSGLDPSGRSVAHARAAGVNAREGGLGNVESEPGDLVVSVNVIEHVPDPVLFIRRASEFVRAAGALVLVCPDGAAPSIELLFADHLWSLTAGHLSAIARRADVAVVASARAPDDLGRFQMIRIVPAPHQAGGAEPVEHAGVDQLLEAKRDYLRAWADLDRILIDRLQGATTVTCFGIGEAAALIRAYAPATWSRVTECVADDPEYATFAERPVRAWSDGLTPHPVLLAVRPGAQPALAERLEHQVGRIVRWDDVIAA